MADPVVVISGAKEAGKKSRQGSLPKRDKARHRQDCAEDDSVEISQEAHDRVSGKRRRNILEYLDDEGD